MENTKKIRIASMALQAIAVTGLITGIVTNTAMPVVAGAASSFLACCWQVAVYWGNKCD